MVARVNPLDAVLARPQWHTRHTLWIEAEPGAVLAAALAVTLGEIPQAWAQRRAVEGSTPVFVDLGAQGFVRLPSDPASLVLGRIGQVWRLAAIDAELSPDRFASFAEPGYAKAVVGLWTEPFEAGCFVCAETRLAATDPATYREFNRHWLVGTWASGHNQRDLLQAVRARIVAGRTTAAAR